MPASMTAATGWDSRDDPMKTTGLGFGARTNLPRSRKRLPSFRAIRFQSNGWLAASFEKEASPTRSTTVCSQAISVALRRAVGSITAISPTCWPPFRIAISRSFNFTATTPQMIRKRSVAPYQSLPSTKSRSLFLKPPVMKRHSELSARPGVFRVILSSPDAVSRSAADTASRAFSIGK